LREFKVYVHEIAERHRHNPASVSPLVASMLDAEAQERLTHSELAGLFVQLLLAGHETTTTLIQQGLLELMFHRDQWDVLCAEPALADNAVEECCATCRRSRRCSASRSPIASCSMSPCDAASPSG
jgi:cytochrome P450